MSLWHLLVVCVVAFAAHSSPSHFRQLSSMTNEFQVNTYATLEQFESVVAVLADGSFVIAWASDEQDGSKYGVYAQRFDASGNAVGAEFQVNTYTAEEQYYPDIAALSGGGFVIAWMSNGQDGANFGVYAQRYDSSGNAVGSEFRVNTYTADDQKDPSIASFANGGFIIAWSTFGPDGSGFGVHAKRFDASGSPLEAEFIVNTHTANWQMSPRVAVFSDDGFIVTWRSEEQDGSSTGVFAQRFDSSASPVGVEFQVNTYTTMLQDAPAVAVLPDDSFIITWQSWGQDGSHYGIYAQRYSSSGSTAGTEFRVNTYTANGQYYPAIAADVDIDDGFIIAWESDSQIGSGYEIYAQQYDASGTKVGSEFLVNDYTTSDQRFVSVAAIPTGGYVITWTSNGQDGSEFGIYARFIGVTLTSSAPTSIPTSLPSSLPTAVPTSVPTSPTSVPTSVPSSVPTSIPTSPTSIPTSIPSAAPTTTPTSPTSIPTSVPTSLPTSVPTNQPTSGVSDHIVVHLYDLHGDGWLDNVYLKVSHANGSDLYSLHCSCKVVRIFEEDVSLSLWRNRTVAGPKGDVMPYEWEALWTVGYSDGLTETDFGIVGDIYNQVEIRNYALNSSHHGIDINPNNPNNMCNPPKPKPKAPPIEVNSTESEPDSPSPTVDVRLALQTTNGESWCDDSGSTSVLACDKEHHLSTDAVLPNLVLYPRYYISRTDDNRVVASGTLREDVTEWVTSVKLLREGSYVFSVSGTYTASSGSVSWDFCGEQGGINERLHFNMVKSVCRSHYIEEVSGGLTCYESLTGVLLHDSIVEIQPAGSVIFLRRFTSTLLLVGGATVALVLVLVITNKSKRNNKKFVRLDTTERG